MQEVGAGCRLLLPWYEKLGGKCAEGVSFD